jgi:hypothetical protein
MDHDRVDQLSRDINRRTGLGVLAALGLEAISPVSASAKNKHKKRKRKRKRKEKRRKPPPPGANPACTVVPDTGFSNARRFAQTFIAQRSGQLAVAQCEVSSLFGGEAISFEIRTLDDAGVPTETVLATATLSDLPAFISSGQGLPLAGIFDPPAPISTGVGYALVLTLVADGAGDGELHLNGAEGDLCAGQLFEDTDADGTFVERQQRDILFFASIVV